MIYMLTIVSYARKKYLITLNTLIVILCRVPLTLETGCIVAPGDIFDPFARWKPGQSML
jgi:hypothetical protein